MQWRSPKAPGNMLLTVLWRNVGEVGVSCRILWGGGVCVVIYIEGVLNLLPQLGNR